MCVCVHVWYVHVMGQYEQINLQMTTTIQKLIIIGGTPITTC